MWNWWVEACPEMIFIMYRKKLLIFLFWIAVWSGLALAVDNKILLATPWEAAAELVRLFGKASFYLSVARSLLRVGLGFAAGFAAALLLALGSRRFRLLEEVLLPVMSLIKTVPVASFVVLLLIWWGSSFLAVAICFLVVLPNIYIGTLEGLKNADKRLLQMAQVFRMPLWNRLLYIYRPALKPFLYSSLQISLGMCWKSGVAAEVIGTPDYSIGEALYMAKIYLNTPGVFAWTAVIILVSVCFEKLAMGLAGRFFAWEPSCRRGRAVPEAAVSGIRLKNVCKGFGEQEVLTDVTADYEPGGTYYLTAPSGSGKTTQLHLIAGLLKPDRGEISGRGRISMVFQEDRLCEDYDAVKNVELAIGDRRRAEEALLELLPREALHKPCSQLSGGMKRRVAIVRAMESESEAVLLDEPFAGLDADTRARVEEYIRQCRGQRILIVATHI